MTVPPALSRSARFSFARPTGFPTLRFAAVVAGVGLAAACGRGSNASQAQQGPPPAAVKLVTIQPTEVQDGTELVATVRALQSTTIRPQVEGYLTRIDVQPGDRVAAGARLFQIDAARQRAAVAREDATIAARRADAEYARAQFERMRGLHEQRVVSQQELDQARTALTMAEADVAALEARVSEQKVGLTYFAVTAPTSGIVGDVPVRVGDRVTGDTMLTTIDQVERLEINVPVPVQRATDLRPGLAIEVLDRGGAPIATTTISFVSPRVENATQSILVKGMLANPGGALRPAQIVRARIIWASRPALLVPVLAVLRVNGLPFVFVAEERNGQLVAAQQPVRLGQLVGDQFTVLDGLQPGMRIIVSGVQRLGDGSPVNPQT